MLTKNGVCYDLKESPFTYEWRGIVYFFSSNMHRNHFKRDVVKKEEWLEDSLTRRFKCTVRLPILADIQLYTQIETRGFYVQTNDGAEYESGLEIVITPDMMMVGVNDATI